jgi:hypothetical protein
MAEIPFPNSQFPSFETRRRSGGDYVRAGSSPTPGYEDAATVLRFDGFVPEQIFDALFLSKPLGYHTVQVWWGVPPEGQADWDFMCVTRSGFGHPSTPSDGEIVHYLKNPDDDKYVPGSFFDGNDAHPLPSGRWYYYTLFFRINGKWIAANTTETLVPIDYGHRDHLLGLVPPFYLEREVNDSTDFITRWMTMIGYDLDYTRTLAEGVQQIYDPDSAPQTLLDAMGQNNLGFTKPSAMGDIRYRSVLANNRAILFHRGTPSGLQTYVQSVFKSTVTVSKGLNELLLVDDAEFYTGVGNWCPMPWRIGHELATGPNGTIGVGADSRDMFRTRNVTIEHFTNESTDLPDAIWNTLPSKVSAVRGLARIQASDGEQLAITCGAGQQDVIVGVDSKNHRMELDEQHLDAFYRGIPVDTVVDPITHLPTGKTYYLSFWSRRDPGDTVGDLIVFGFAQFDRNPATQGFSDGFRNAPFTAPMGTAGGFNGWQRRLPNAASPAAASLKQTRRAIKSGAGSDGWEHLVFSDTLASWCRYIVPFIWYQYPDTGDTGPLPDPVTTPRYITAVMVNQSQSGGVDIPFHLDQYLLLLEDAPTKHLIGGPGEDLAEGVRDDYKVIGEPPT